MASILIPFVVCPRLANGAKGLGKLCMNSSLGEIATLPYFIKGG